MSSMAHMHHHSGINLQHDSGAAKAIAGCDCGCACGDSTCAHACHAAGLGALAFQLDDLAPSSAYCVAYSGVRLAAHAAPPLRPPAIL